ncbi:glycosyltransferase family 2 protein [Bradyrhizobium sp. LHD-71]|uniref:glycosyltransferase family 2 protein n=1 Tax=Bradyrhizobium sp. LHD-71 TaxID=3072141 RepID=UPI00280E0D83|nr:glycosyltransferase family 2 protein [Bradyrhizobium sp. LHD-71]MDQ8727967.1 glycosyltransferase family 2 protein [Bradyrhizobium sp. LHD-71]
MPTSKSDVWVIIPAFNEGSVIGRVVREVTHRYPNVVVVDDGSTDCTAAKAAAEGAVVINHPINLGQGAALQTGIEFAVSRGAARLATFDADGQHQVRDIVALLDALDARGVDFALGTRFLGSGSNVPTARRLLLRLAVWFTRLTTGLVVSDTHNGLRAMTRRGAAAISIRQNRMAHASEILQQIADSGLDYVEVPVTVAYTGYSLTKGQRLTGSIDVIVDLMAERLHR